MRISVCMATYNGEKYIKEQTYSILKQLGVNDEIIASDDGSSDNTVNVLNGINDSRIKVVHNMGKHGYTYNFENALRHASGNIIFLSDQDDIWCQDKVEKVLSKLKIYDFVIHDCKMVDSEMNVLSESRFSDLNVKFGFMWQMIRMRYLGCCMAFNRKMLDAMLPFPKNKYLVEHDTWIASFGELYFKTYRMPEQLILYRRHGNNVSDGGIGEGYSLHIKIIRRLYRLGCLLQKVSKVIKAKRRKQI